MQGNWHCQKIKLCVLCMYIMCNGIWMCVYLEDADCYLPNYDSIFLTLAKYVYVEDYSIN